MKGIMFKEFLFHKVVAGEKNQTRRIIFPDTNYTFWSQPSFEGMEKDPEDVYILDKDGEMNCYKDGEPKFRKIKGTYGLFEGDQFFFHNSYVKPRYQPDEVVFLKEPYRIIIPKHHPEDTGIQYAFEFTPNERKVLGIEKIWENKMFQSAKYARYFIQITDVTAQRLHNITEADARAEGFRNIADFQSIWISLHGFHSWPSNPWVWVYSFTLTQKP